MYEYKAPLKDFEFIYFELFDYERHLARFPEFSEVSRDVVKSINSEFATFCQEVITPINQSGDTEGCHLEDGQVRTPAGFKEAFAQYVAAGWPGMAYQIEYGGQACHSRCSTPPPRWPRPPIAPGPLTQHCRAVQRTPCWPMVRTSRRKTS